MDQCNAIHNPLVPGFTMMKDEGDIKVDSTLFMERATKLHLKAAKIVLRYLKNTVSFGLFYKNGGNEELVGYTYSDYTGDQDDMKSTSGYVFMLSSRAISWSSKKQLVVTSSTTKAEFIAASLSTCQAV
ncbi:secreted RxLR effector protein 161-like [Pyrus communis]|uniref:secreted RxLR effector protein 161-like n=1 Tax=Pyrus communis TaxID=23211 RepID=UPI0035C24B5E